MGHIINPHRFGGGGGGPSWQFDSADLTFYDCSYSSGDDWIISSATGSDYLRNGITDGIVLGARGSGGTNFFYAALDASSTNQSSRNCDFDFEKVNTTQRVFENGSTMLNEADDGGEIMVLDDSGTIKYYRASVLRYTSLDYVTDKYGFWGSRDNGNKIYSPEYYV